MSQHERLLILQMVAEKKLSADEAYELILALDATEPTTGPVVATAHPSPPVPPIAPGRSGHAFSFSGLSTLIEGLVDRVTTSFSDSAGPMYEFTTELTGEFAEEVIPLQVATGNGRITLHTSNQAECRVVVTTKVSGQTEDEARVRAQNAYKAEITPGGFTLKTAEDNSGGMSVSANLYLPRDHRYRVNARTGNGRIQVSAISMTECQASTGNGRIQVDSVAADQIIVRTGNGSIQIEAEAARLSAESGNGSISVTPQGMGNQRLDLSTGNGSIKINTVLLPLDAGKRVEARTVLSRIQVNVANMTVEEESRGVGNRRFVGQSQGFESAAQQVTILAKTSTGSVTID